LCIYKLLGEGTDHVRRSLFLVVVEIAIDAGDGSVLSLRVLEQPIDTRELVFQSVSIDFPSRGMIFPT